LQGFKFGKWTVYNEIKTNRPGKNYECMCECGTIQIKSGTELRAGRGMQCRDCQYKELYDPNNMIGKKFGKWTVVKFIDVHRNLHRFEVVCDCGNKSIQLGSDLRRKKLRSSQCSTCHNRENARGNITHGMHNTQIYNIWKAMKDRCNNPKSTPYRWYGERGISVCERWNKFENFLEDMGERPEGMTLDRIDNDGNYEPGNCRWVTHKDNCNNRVKRNK
jgi:hypothetical protein